MLRKLIDAIKNTLEKFYGQDPIQSADLSRIVNSSHFVHLTRLLDDPKVSDKVIYGGQRDEKRLIIAPPGNDRLLDQLLVLCALKPGINCHQCFLPETIPKR